MQTPPNDCSPGAPRWLISPLQPINRETVITGALLELFKPLAHLKSLGLHTKNQVKNLGIILYSDLRFDTLIRNVTKVSFYHLRNIAMVRAFLSQANTETLMHAFITSRLDYCNALLSGLPKKAIGRLQLVQNAAARVLTKTRQRTHII